MRGGNKTGHQTGTELSLWEWRRSVWRRDKVQRWFTAALTRTMTPGRHGRRQNRTESRTSSTCSARIFSPVTVNWGFIWTEPEVTVETFWWLWFSSCPVWIKRVLQWVYKEIHLIIAQLKRETWIQTVHICIFLFSKENECQNISFIDLLL